MQRWNVCRFHRVSVHRHPTCSTHHPLLPLTETALRFSFCSLYQKGNDGEQRTPAETQHFSEALGSLSRWYAHPKTIILKVTKLPEGYPNGFTFPEGITANQADYYGRGWCYCESSLCNLVKDFDYVLDLANLPLLVSTDAAEEVRAIARACRAGRAVPLLPATFSNVLESKSFTSKKADLQVVSSIYAAGFATRMASAKQFNFTGLQWGDDQVSSLAAVLRGGGLALAEELFLNMNRITDAGIATLATAMCATTDEPPCLSKLATLNLSSNQIGDAGASALIDALGDGALPSLTKIHLEQNLVSVELQHKLNELLTARNGGKEAAETGGAAVGGGAAASDEDATEVAYIQACEAVKGLRKSDLQEVKSMANPPLRIKQTCDAVAILLGQDPKTSSWNNSKKLLNDPKFLTRLLEFDVGQVTTSMLAALDVYLQDETCTPEKLAMIGRLGAALCEWVRGVALVARIRLSASQ
jgi:hypothetical protein